MKYKLKDLCTVKKSTLKNCKTVKGYPLFLSPNVIHKTDKFEFNGESVLVKTMGRNIHEIRFVNCDFSVGCGVWVLQDFKIDPFYLKHKLVKELKRYEFNTSKYDACVNLHRKDLENIQIDIEEEKIVELKGNLYRKVDEKLKLEQRIKKLYEEEKTYFLRNMFV